MKKLSLSRISFVIQPTTNCNPGTSKNGNAVSLFNINKLNKTKNDFSTILANKTKSSTLSPIIQKRNFHRSSTNFEIIGWPKEDTRPHTLLIDGSHLFYRGFYAHKHLTNGALYGFCRILLRVLSDMKPYDYIVICGDTPRRDSFRLDILPEYKSTRTLHDPDVGNQYRKVKDAADAWNVAYVSMPRYEADEDDCIGAYTKLALKEGHKVTIVSVDKDLMQLVDDKKVIMYDFVNKKNIDEKDVLIRFGVPPPQVPHVLALIGDKSDNVPGVNGINAEMAAYLIKEYKTVSNLLKKSANLASIGPVAKKNLDIVKLVDDIPVPPLEFIKYKPTDDKKLIQWLKDTGFPSLIENWLRQIPGADIELPKEEKPKKEKKEKKPSIFEPALVAEKKLQKIEEKLKKKSEEKKSTDEEKKPKKKTEKKEKE